MAVLDLPPSESRCSILELSPEKTRKFLLKHESYCDIGLPPYFNFNGILSGVSHTLDGRLLSELQGSSAKEHDGVNHIILNNKDGKHAWRPLQLIHPALYVSLVNRITEPENWQLIQNRFEIFSGDEKIRCFSLPVASLTKKKDKAEQIAHWWQQVEQSSIELAMDYNYVIHTDITDCYGSIYTHSIGWALHSKSEAKKRENRNNKSLLGNIIDIHVQGMQHGQTNGIPQGSILMDLIAEIVLGYADINLGTQISKLKIEDYRIIRYRDDYRIFVNNQQDGDRILKCLTEVMIDLGMKLNPAKTKVSSQIIRSSIKGDKLAWICRKQSTGNLQKHLLIIHNHSLEFPNSGSLSKALSSFHKRIVGLKKYRNPLPLISIVVDIAHHNPRTYAICAAILSKLISFFESSEEKKEIINKTRNKFSQIPNTGHMDVWLQRISLQFDPDAEFDEPLCHLVNGNSIPIWNNEWISSQELLKVFDISRIVTKSVVESLDSVVPVKEVALFTAKAEYES